MNTNSQFHVAIRDQLPHANATSTTSITNAFIHQVQYRTARHAGINYILWRPQVEALTDPTITLDADM